MLLVFYANVKTIFLIPDSVLHLSLYLVWLHARVCRTFCQAAGSRGLLRGLRERKAAGSRALLRGLRERKAAGIGTAYGSAPAGSPASASPAPPAGGGAFESSDIKTDINNTPATTLRESGEEI